jgi:hypothetical protein
MGGMAERPNSTMNSLGNFQNIRDIQNIHTDRAQHVVGVKALDSETNEPMNMETA